MRVGLVNLYSDNFGDYLNLRAAERFVTERLGGQVAFGWFGGRAWETDPPTHGGYTISSPVLGTRRLRPDVARHCAGRSHRCPNRTMWETIRGEVARCDLVLSVPSGAAVGPYRGDDFLVPFVAAREAGTPAAMYFGTVHPSGSRTFDLLARAALEDSTLAVRDALSGRIVESWGREAIGPADPTLLEVARAPAWERAPGREVIAVVLGDSLAWHPRGRTLEGRNPMRRRILEEVVHEAATLGLAVELVPHSPLPGELQSLNELAMISPIVTVRHDVLVVEDYIAALAGARLVVSLRYHGVVTALGVGVRAVAVAYEPKSHSLASTSGEAVALVPSGAFTGEGLRTAIRTQLARGPLGTCEIRRSLIMRAESLDAALADELLRPTECRGSHANSSPSLQLACVVVTDPARRTRDSLRRWSREMRDTLLHWAVTSDNGSVAWARSVWRRAHARGH